MKDLSDKYRLFTFENADHSLETGDVVRDIEIIGEVISAVRTEIQ